MKKYLDKSRIILNAAEWRSLAFLVAGSIIASISEVFSIGIIIPIMSLFLDPSKIHSSRLLANVYKFSGAGDTVSFTVALIITAFFLFLLRMGLSVFMLYQQQKVIGGIYCRLTNAVLKAYLTKPYIFHVTHNSSVLFKNISSDVSNYVFYFINPVITISSELILLIGIYGMLVMLYPWMMLALLVIFGVAAYLINSFFKRKITAYGNDREIFSEKMYKTALESLGAVKEIQVYQAQDFFAGRHYEAIRCYTNGYVKFTVLSGMPRLVFELILFGCILSVILFGVFFHISSAKLIPMLVVIGVSSLRMLPSFTRIYAGVGLFQYGKKTIDIVHDILLADREAVVPVDDGDKDCSSVNKVAVGLKDIDFSYAGTAEPIFQKINLEIPLGAVVAFIGETGSGKSTLMDIVMGLLRPSSGTLVFCNKAVKEKDLSGYRARIGYVPQNIYLTDDTIEGNIAFGENHEKIDRERLKKSLTLAQLDTFIAGLPGGTATRVGERGAMISGGQKQRIGIARALYRKPEILVLDEATSALDVRTEAELYHALRGMGKEVSIVMVTHRLSALEHADKIFCMDHGKIVASGTYEELKVKSAVFQRIVQQKH